MDKKQRVEKCSVCNSAIRVDGQPGYEPLTVDENDKEIVLEHCPHCGTLFVHVETIPVNSR